MTFQIRSKKTARDRRKGGLFFAKTYTFLLYKGTVMFFSWSPRKEPKEGDLRGHSEKACPLKKPLRRLAGRLPKMFRFSGVYQEEICRFRSCKRSKIGTFLDAGWRGGGGFQRGGAPRSESIITIIAGGNHTITYTYLQENAGGSSLRLGLLKMIILYSYADRATLGNEGGGQEIDVEFCFRHGFF